MAGYLGNYAQGDAAVDLTHRIRTDNALSQQWTNILPFYRQSNGVYDNKVFMLPVSNILMNPLQFVKIPCIYNLFISHIKIQFDDNGYFLFYRRDLFSRYNVTVPRTWDELQNAIEFFHGLHDEVTNMTYHGLCLNRRKGCGAGASFHIPLGTISQTLGTTQGSFVDPSTGELIPKEAMIKAVEIMDRTVPYSDPDGKLAKYFQINMIAHFLKYITCSCEDFLGGTVIDLNQCLSTKFTSGQCAATYGTFNLAQGTVEQLLFNLTMGVAPLPASDIVVDRATGTLTNCSSSLCPFGVQITGNSREESKTVNYASFYGIIGRVFGVSTWTSAIKQDAVIKFATHVIANSDDDAIPGLDGRFRIVHPYQLSHLNETKWLEKNHSLDYVRPLLDSFERSSSENANILPRVGDVLTSFNSWLHHRVSEHLEETVVKGNEGIKERRIEFVDMVRGNFSTRVLNNGTFLEIYQRSLGIFQKPAEQMFIPDSLFITCMVFSCMVICLAVGFALYLHRNRSGEVVVAFFPNLMLLNCIGSCMIGVAIMFSALDEQRVSLDSASYACRMEPTFALLGQSFFLCSMLTRIIFNVEFSRRRSQGMANSIDSVNIGHIWKSLMVTTVPTLVGVVVFLVYDDPVWDPNRYVDDDEVWGLCSATLTSSRSLSFVSYWFMLLIALSLSIMPFSKYIEVQRPWIILSLAIYLQAMVCCLPILKSIEDNPTAFLTTRMLYYLIIAVVSFIFFMIPMTLRREKTLKRIVQYRQSLLIEEKRLSEAREILRKLDEKVRALLEANLDLVGKTFSCRSQLNSTRYFRQRSGREG